MKEKDSVSKQLTIFLPTERGREWEERLVCPPSRTRTIGNTVLGYIKQPRVYEYTDATASLILVLDHLLR